MDTSRIKETVCSKIKNRLKKTMFSIFFSLKGFIVIKFLPTDEKFNSSYMVNTILSGIDSKMKTYRPKSTSKRIFIHMGNVLCYNSKITMAKIEEYGMTRIHTHPTSLIYHHAIFDSSGS